MKPDNIELCSAILTVGSGNPAADYIRSETFERLAELALVQQFEGRWQLTAAGFQLLPSLESGDTLPDLE